MEHDVLFPARDGRQLQGTLFPAARPRGAVVMASAMGVRRRLYARFARHLAEGGLTCLTFDYRGIGGSRQGSLRRDPARLHEWGELDLAGALDWLRQRSPGLPLQLVTHSVGGQVFGLIEDAPVDGAVFIASQSGSWRLWRGLGRVAMFVIWHALLPGFARVLGYIPMKVLGQGEDLPGGVGAEWAEWGRQNDYVWSYARPRGGLGFTRWAGALRTYAITDDAYAPREGVEALAAMYTRARAEVRVVSPTDLGAERAGHFGIFKPHFRDSLWSEVRDTLLGRIDQAAGVRTA